MSVRNTKPYSKRKSKDNLGGTHIFFQVKCVANPARKEGFAGSGLVIVGF